VRSDDKIARTSADLMRAASERDGKGGPFGQK
jgi:hypothetical protein